MRSHFVAAALALTFSACAPDREYPRKPVPEKTNESEKQYDPKYDYTRDDSKSGKAQPKRLIAVVGGILQGESPDDVAADELITSLAKKADFVLVERARIKGIIHEKALFDPGEEVLRRLRETERAEVYIAGRYRETSGDQSRGKWRMDIKVISVTTTKILFASDVYANTTPALAEAAAEALHTWATTQ